MKTLGVIMLNLRKLKLEQISDILIKISSKNSNITEKYLDMSVKKAEIITTIYPQASITPNIGAVRIHEIKKFN